MAWFPDMPVALGTDGFGRSESRAALRRFFEVDTGHVVAGTLAGLAADGVVEPQVVEDAMKRYEINTEVGDPRTR